MQTTNADAYWQCARQKYLVGNENEVCVMRLFRTLSLGASILASACTGSQATLALRPDFDITTLAGPASVSIRETPPEMTFAEFEQAVSAGMQSARPTCGQTTPVAAPFPARRIVWHVYPIFPRGTSRLVVNVFDGSVPTVEAQDVIDNTAPRSSIEYAVRTLTRRLMAKLDQRDQASG
jgi:hypothetical protein